MKPIWGNMKVGNTVLMYYEANYGQLKGPSRVVVQSIGPKWITIDRGVKFHRDTGRGEFAYQLHTSITYEMYMRRHAALRRIRDGERFLGQLPLEELEAIAALYPVGR